MFVQTWACCLSISPDDGSPSAHRPPATTNTRNTCARATRPLLQLPPPPPPPRLPGPAPPLLSTIPTCPSAHTANATRRAHETGTENALNRELGEDQYRHVSVAYPLACPDLGCLALLDRLPSEGPQAGNPDWLDALLVGLDMLARAEAAQGEIKGALVKRVTLISNFVRAVADIPDDQRDQLVTTMQNAGYSLEAVAVGEGRQLAADGFRLADRQANLDMLDRLLAEVGRRRSRRRRKTTEPRLGLHVQ